jgi:hypothetical protein
MKRIVRKDHHPSPFLSTFFSSWFLYDNLSKERLMKRLTPIQAHNIAAIELQKPRSQW